MVKEFSYLLNSISHLFYPHHCAGCGNDIIDDHQLLCLRCLHDLPVTHFHKQAQNPVEKLFWGRLPVATAFSYLFFTKDSMLQQLLHQLKYKGNKEIGFFLGQQMGMALQDSSRDIVIDAIVPLPLFPSREKKRGYNQATVISKGIADILKVPVLDAVVFRTKSTETQTHKSRVERWQNMEGKFLVKNKEAIANKNILLVDDVITTGATLEACGQVLLKEGLASLHIGSLAYTL